MNNKEQIAVLQKEIDKDLSVITSIEYAIEMRTGKIDELKKESEIKPVFPDWGDRVDSSIWGIFGGKVTVVNFRTDIDSLREIGLTFYSKEGAEKELARKEARKFVIEAINKANKGDNGFKLDADNFCVISDRGRLCSDQWIGIQLIESVFYFRTNKGCVDALSAPEFLRAYKTMLGIN